MFAAVVVARNLGGDEAAGRAEGFWEEGGMECQITGGSRGTKRER